MGDRFGAIGRSNGKKAIFRVMFEDVIFRATIWWESSGVKQTWVDVVECSLTQVYVIVNK